MKNMTWKFLGMGLTALISISPVARGQMGQQGMGQQSGMGGGMSHSTQTGQQSTQGTQQTPPPQAQTPPAALPPVDPVEEADYKKVTGKHSDPKVMVADATDFLTKYPKSRYNSIVYAQLANAYLQLGDPDKTGSAAQKAVDLNPDNPDAVSLLAYVFLRGTKAGPVTMERVRVTEALARHGIQLLNALQKPPEVSDADFDTARKEKLSMCHSAMGYAYLNESKNQEAAQELVEAIHLSSSPDPVDQFLLGVAYESSKQYAQALTAYEACAKDPAIGPRCAQGLKDVKDKAKQ
jgi:Flp pilus assembly protein TadD